MTESQKTYLYNFIYEARLFTEDKSWNDTLISCASGKFPRGIKYDPGRGTLFVRCAKGCKNPTEIISLPTVPKMAYKTLMYIFRELLALRSVTDTADAKQVMETIRDDQVIDMSCSWKDLKKKYVKNHLIAEYSVELVEDYGLDPKCSKKLYNLIQLGIQFKNIAPKDIEYDGKKINNISGLEFDEDTVFFKITNPKGPIQRPAVTKSDILEKSVERWCKTRDTTRIKTL